MKLKHFKCEPIASFAAAVNRFESLYVFWLQLDSPHTADNIRLLSYEVVCQITQYLLSPRCAQQFSKWSSDTIKVGGQIDKDIIIKTVSQLESYADLKLHSPRTLPGSLITTTLGLPVSSTEQNVNAHFANPLPPQDLRSSARSSSNGRPRIPSYGSRPPSTGPRTSSNGPRTPSNGPRSSSGSKHQSQRQQSKSPRRANHKNEQRGCSNVRSSSSSNAHSADISINPDYESLRFSSHYSNSHTPARKQHVPQSSDS